MKKLKYEEKEMLKMMSLTGGFTYAILISENHFNMNPRRLNDMIKSDYLERKEYNEKINGKTVKRYTFVPSEEGIKFLNKEGIEHIQRGTGIGHLEKAEKYIFDKVKNEGVKIHNILNESKQREHLKYEIQNAEKRKIDFLVCDFVILEEETQEIQEVMEIENNYSQKLINKHKNYAKQVLKQEYKSIK